MAAEPIIDVQHLEHTYMKGTPFVHQALTGVSITVYSGECVAIIGHTGSGKSTLVQHFNGLILPQKGKVIVDGADLSDKKTDMKGLRQKVGLVFQDPESQIFESLVGDEIAYGPFKMGWPIKDVRDAVKGAMEMAGLPFDAMKDRPTAALSGGQKRKVALAGVLALKPKILVLDEPTAGLDPRSGMELLGRLKTLNEQEHLTIVFISHHLEEVAYLADRIYVLDHGKNIGEGSPATLFSNKKMLEKYRIGTPETVDILYRLQDAGFSVNVAHYGIAEVASQICSILEHGPRRDRYDTV
ncbi:energy-coupling factor transporter ATPase [Sporolactobacillus sp. THM7-7]|nr:energy-coupling factor transporter ATPase [Sporolactobacillus sp. THM7-7]